MLFVKTSKEFAVYFKSNILNCMIKESFCFFFSENFQERFKN